MDVRSDPVKRLVMETVQMRHKQALTIECEICHQSFTHERIRGPRPVYCKNCQVQYRRDFTKAWNRNLSQARIIERQLNTPLISLKLRSLIL
jgi:ribosomal protein L44E